MMAILIIPEDGMLYYNSTTNKNTSQCYLKAISVGALRRHRLWIIETISTLDNSNDLDSRTN